AMLRIRSVQGSWRKAITVVAECGLGLSLIWVVRPYLVQISVLAWWVGVILVIGFYARRNGLSKQLAVSLVAIVLLHGTVVSSSWFGNHGGTDSAAAASPSPVLSDTVVPWVDPLTGYIRQIDHVRQRFFSFYPDAGSMIDREVRLSSVEDLVR